jgi:type II secretion system protein G
MTPLLQLVRGLGLMISPFVIFVGFFGEPPIDFNRVRYMVGSLQVEALAKAVESYRADCGEYPSARDGLDALVLDRGTVGWHGPYLQHVEQVLHDPWGHSYIYTWSPDSAPEILSYGADGKPGGEFFDADISSRNLHHHIPQSPSETRSRRLAMGIWIGAWSWLIASLFLLFPWRKSSQSK